jgi:hypothetical protein
MQKQHGYTCLKSSDVAWLSGTLDDIERVRLRLLYFTV